MQARMRRKQGTLVECREYICELEDAIIDVLNGRPLDNCGNRNDDGLESCPNLSRDLRLTWIRGRLNEAISNGKKESKPKPPARG